MAKIYIATTLTKRKDHNVIRDLLEIGGHEITYDWTLHHSFDQKDFQFDFPEARRLAIAERNGVVNADMLVVLLPGKKGTHIEIGMALAKNIPIILHSEDEEDFSFEGKRCVFYFHPSITRLSCPLTDLETILENINKKLEVPALI